MLLSTFVKKVSTAFNIYVLDILDSFSVLRYFYLESWYV